LQIENYDGRLGYVGPSSGKYCTAFCTPEDKHELSNFPPHLTLPLGKLRKNYGDVTAKIK
jgi:hypothetical protein